MKLQNLKRNLIVMFGLITLFACNRKDGEFTLASGVVTDARTGRPIPFATVEVRSEDTPPCFLCPSFNRYETIVFENEADQNGRFSFGFATDKNLRYAISARSERYYSIDNANVYLIEDKDNRNLDVRLFPFAWLKLVVKNEFPIDTATINIETRIGSLIDLPDISTDTIILNKTNYYGKIKIEQFISKKSGFTIRQDSVQLLMGDTTLLEIKY